MSNTPSSKSKHPWRICLLGEHGVSEHLRVVSPSPLNPDGTTSVRGHCRKDPSGHEIFVADEFREIANLHFKEVKERPASDSLGFPNGNQFDESIAGWAKFWNEVFTPDVPLYSNLIKALIASESGFRSGIEIPSNSGNARGLIQITESTRKILGDQKGELRDYLITLSKDEVLDPNINLAAGIRWLFYKRTLAANRLNREATWEEAIAEYKGILGQLGRNEDADEIMKRLRKYYERLRKFVGP